MILLPCIKIKRFLQWSDPTNTASLCQHYYFLRRSKNLLISKSFKMVKVGVFLTFRQDFFFFLSQRQHRHLCLISLRWFRESNPHKKMISCRKKSSSNTPIFTSALIHLLEKGWERSLWAKCAGITFLFRPTNLNKWTRMSPLGHIQHVMILMETHSLVFPVSEPQHGGGDRQQQ